jgi:hypothetical protein
MVPLYSLAADTSFVISPRFLEAGFVGVIDLTSNPSMVKSYY